jgi:hypothetical protein
MKTRVARLSSSALEVAPHIASSSRAPAGAARPMPLALTDDEYEAVQAAAAPIHPLQRGTFLQALATELERHPVVGPGLVHSYAAELQRKFVRGTRRRHPSA